MVNEALQTLRAFLTMATTHQEPAQVPHMLKHTQSLTGNMGLAEVGPAAGISTFA